MRPLDPDQFQTAPQAPNAAPHAQHSMRAPEVAPRAPVEGGSSLVSEAVARALGARRGQDKSGQKPSAPKDPAPSRVAYRMNRLWLTPSFRFFMRKLAPALGVAACVALWFTDADHRQSFSDSIAAVTREVQTRPEFMVKLMAVDGASPALAEDIRAATLLDFPLSSFDLDLPGLMDRIEALDAVAEVGLRVRAGGILQVDVTERVPAVVWRGPQGLSLLDADGMRVAQLAQRVDAPQLPLIAGEGAERHVGEALALLTLARPLRDRTRGIVRVGERRWNLVLDRGQTVMLPEVAPMQAMEQVMALHAAQDLLERDITEIDMRNPVRPTLRLTDTARTELRRVMGLELGVSDG